MKSRKIYVGLAFCAVLAVHFAAFRRSSFDIDGSILNSASFAFPARQEEVQVGNEQHMGAVSGQVFTGQVIRESAISRSEAIPICEASHFENVQNKRCEIPLVGVTTTIKSRTKCIDETAALIKVVVVSDIGGEPYHDLSNVTYLGLQDQARLYPGLHGAIPTSTFSRKNLGLAHAFLSLNACAVWDFDDDNCVSASTRSFLSSVKSSGLKKPFVWLTSKLSTVNPYLVYGSSEFIWPRGLPLEHLSEREFPRIVLSEGLLDDVETDVVQVMQNYDPDVDALWRLQHAKNLPTDWKPSAVLEDNLLGIHPSRMTPFNAQATVLSRRALAIAFLPSTVHGRVSDIWRSYIVQYFLSRAVPTGAVAFSGAMVIHNRSKHNYMADFNAESQLYDQTMALIEYLGSRHLEELSACDTYVRLMDDLYMRGFVEIGDVKAAAAWANLTLKGSSQNLVQLQNNTFPPLPGPPPKNRVVAVLHINHRHVEVVPLWMALHGYKFRAVKVYVPGLRECLPISGLTIQCISDDFAGYFAYESMLHAISLSLTELADVEGFLFLHDDVVWQPTLTFGSASRGLGPCPQKSEKGEDLGCFPSLMPNDTAWTWASSAIGWKAFKKFQKELEGSNDPKSSLAAFYGQSDFYYISRKETATFLKYGKQMRLAELFLEIAVPTLMVSYLGVNNETLKLATDWSHKRSDPDAMKALLQSLSADVVHPIKLITPRGILAHIM
jgi:hypothetical protein